MSDSFDEAQFVYKMRLLHQLEIQQAQFGIHTPADIALQIQDLRREVAELQYYRTRSIFQTNQLDLEPPPWAQGLILLVSPQSSTEALHDLSSYHAIQYHRTTLGCCWLIATDGPDGSLATAEALAKNFGVYQIHSIVCPITNGADAAETQAMAAAIYAQLAQDSGWSQAYVIADITDGSKAMVAGLTLACGTTHPMQYMLYKQDLPPLPVLLHTQLYQEST